MEVNADKAEAHFEKGVLRLSLPKVEEAKSKRIDVITVND
jgi:HSP20 family molecular chaperone IbpA